MTKSPFHVPACPLEPLSDTGVVKRASAPLIERAVGVVMAFITEAGVSAS